jgi:DNA-binding winged helix-turn-helix (wHTH) protein
MTDSFAPTGEVVSFGPFSLAVSERLLTKGSTPVELSARALDILIRLASQPNKVVSKRDLLAHVWPDMIVEEGSLRFHIANLRRALGDGIDGARYIATLTGRGRHRPALSQRTFLPTTRHRLARTDRCRTVAL